MEKTITIMNNKNVNQSKSKVLFILLIVLFAPLMLLSQNESDNQDFDGHDYINRHKSQIDFLPIDSILEKTWQVDVKNDVCVPLVVNNLIFPSVLERVVINSENGLKYDFGSQEAIRLFDKEKFDSIICFPANECISLINIYTNQVIFSFKRYLRPNREGPFFPENNILYYGYNNLLIAYNFRERRNLWQTEIDNYSKNFHLNYKKYIIINDMSNLLLIEKNTGKIEKKYKTRNSYSKILKDKELFYVGSNEIVKINLETLKFDTLVYTKTYDLVRDIYLEPDSMLYYSLKYKLYYFSLTNHTSKQVTDQDVCSDFYYKIGNYIFASDIEGEYGTHTTIYDIKKGLPIYKYFFVKRDGDFYTYDRCLYSFNPKLTSNGLLIGYTLRGEIQAFRFRNK